MRLNLVELLEFDLMCPSYPRFLSKSEQKKWEERKTNLFFSLTFSLPPLSLESPKSLNGQSSTSVQSFDKI